MGSSLTPGAGSQSPGARSQSQAQPTARLPRWHGKSKSSGRSTASFFFPTWSNHPSLPANCLLSALHGSPSPLQSSLLPHFEAQELPSPAPRSHPAKPLCPAPTGPDSAAPGSATRGLERQAGCQRLGRACGWFWREASAQPACCSRLQQLSCLPGASCWWGACLGLTENTTKRCTEGTAS